MKDFFHGWRRKAGVVTLVMACVLMGLWMRGHGTADQVCYSPFSTISIRGRIAVIFDARTIPPGAAIFTTFDAAKVGNFRPDAYGNCPVWWETPDAGARWDFAGLHVAKANRPDGNWSFEFGFPNLYLTVPLTLLSAYLLLWKPRKRPESTLNSQNM